MTKTEEVYSILRENIMAGKYAYGEIINELDIANTYNVSKTPAREALSLLCQEGYLVKYARKGYIVREVTLQEYAYLMQYRVILETAVVKMIIAHVDDKKIIALKDSLPHGHIPYLKANNENAAFHIALSELAGNIFITDALKQVLCKNARNTGINWYKQVESDFHADHFKLLDALLQRDVKQAVDLIVKDATQSDLVNMIDVIKD